MSLRAEGAPNSDLLKVTVWCALSAKGIIGPFWFQNTDGSTATITTERYVQVLNRFWKELQTRHPQDMTTSWFQQDGAPPHTSHVTLQWLKDHFSGRLISRKTENVWPAHSPDISPLDFYLWGYLKSRVYRTCPQTLVDLKKAIRREIRGISLQTCQKAIEDVTVRAELCKQQNGGHVEHLL